MARRKTAAERDLEAQEKGANDLRPARYARGFVNAVNPENELEVVFKPGELLPAWAKETEHDTGTA